MTTVLIDTPAAGRLNGLMDRFTSAVLPGEQLPRLPEEVHIPKSASYTYIPQLKTKALFDSGTADNGSLSPRDQQQLSPKATTTPTELNRRSGPPTGGASMLTETQPHATDNAKVRTRATATQRFR